MSGNIENKILAWLDKHGYPLEMFAASTFQKNGFQVTQSVMYVDSEIGISREIDIVAHKTFQIENFYFHFSALIECKSTKSKPWLSFIVNNNPNLILGPTNYNSTRHGELLLESFMTDKIPLEDLFPSSINKHGYALTQAFRENEGIDMPYKAIQTLNKALDFLIKKVGNRYGSIAFYFPIVVIENPLFEIELNADDSLSLNEVNSTTYLGRKAENNSSYFIVDVVTKSVINNYARLLGSKIDKFYHSNYEYLKEFVSSNNNIYTS